MTNSDDLIAALKTVGINLNDVGPPGQHHWSQQFNRYHRGVVERNEVQFDRPLEMIALDAMSLLGKALRAGTPSQEILETLASFIEGIEAGASQSIKSWDKNVALAYRVLGYNPRGRPPSQRALVRSIDAYDLAILGGDTIVEAEQKAWATYKAVMPPVKGNEKKVRSEERGKVLVTRGADALEVTEAERFFHETLRPALRGARLIQFKKRGPKAKMGS